MPCQILKQENEINSFIQKLGSRKTSNNNVLAEVEKIIANVKERKNSALVEYTQKFDSPNYKEVRAINQNELAVAAGTVSPDDLEIIRRAAINIRDFHENQKEKSWFITKEDGSILGQKVTAINRVGIYVPGGQAGNTPLISSILMNAIPAQVAGVKEIALVSPPRSDGTLNPLILAAAWALDISEIYALGSAWAIAALAYGTQTIKPVDMIAGPGNAYVATAKAIVQQDIAIDMLAGPSEIIIIADDSANPDYIAADMLAQAEHDSLASAIVFTDSAALATKVLKCLEHRLESLPRKEIAKKSLESFGAIIQVKYFEDVFSMVNKLAPEHLEILTYNDWENSTKIINAGAIFLGAYSAEVAGDYFAGPNHILPTNGTARFSSALNVQSFQKKSSIIALSKNFIHNNSKDIAKFARMENLEAHARSVEARS